MKEMNTQLHNKLELAIQIFTGKYNKPFLHQLISSQLDVDRMDYLTRDSFFTGVAEGVIEAIASKGDVSKLGDKEALVISYVRQVLHDHRVDDATWSAANAAFGKEGALELTMTAGYYGMLASFLNVLQIEPASSAPQLAGTKPEGV